MTEYNFINEFEIQAKENQLELAYKSLDEFLESDDYIFNLSQWISDNLEFIQKLKNKNYLFNRDFEVESFLKSLPFNYPQVLTDDIPLENLLPKAVYKSFLLAKEYDIRLNKACEDLIIKSKNTFEYFLLKLSRLNLWKVKSELIQALQIKKLSKPIENLDEIIQFIQGLKEVSNVTIRCPFSKKIEVFLIYLESKFGNDNIKYSYYLQFLKNEKIIKTKTLDSSYFNWINYRLGKKDNDLISKQTNISSKELFIELESAKSDFEAENGFKYFDNL